MIKNQKLFYLLSLTWGLPMSILGYLIGLVLVGMGYKPTKYGYCYCFQIRGVSGSGVSFGPVMVAGLNASSRLKNHEHGHAIQNCFWGFLFPFVIAIPSVTRYWARYISVVTKKKKPTELPDYDAVWYEGGATKIGTEFMEWYNTQQND